MVGVDAYQGAGDVAGWIQQHQGKDLLRILTCGSVDDGKSTLIGRLLHDTKRIYDDQLAALERDSARHGTVGKGIDFALLCDGLKSEREQGITIDVAYRFFSTERRSFIIADCPGHEQYTRNMATGASTCDLAVILVDARHGVVTQTRRHSFIVSLLGIRHVLVAVNKMDLCHFDARVFQQIRADYTDFAAKLDLPDVTFVPISALEGDNIVERSPRTPWYDGTPLLTHLETVHHASDANLVDFRFPVQYVLRPDLDFRGYAGTVASGSVRPGDPVVILPSGQRSTVQRVVGFDGDLAEARAGRAVTLTLSDERDCSRGDLICHPGNRPDVAESIEAMVVWMGQEPLDPRRPYWLRTSAHTALCRIDELRYEVDVNTLHRQPGQGLGLNGIGKVVVGLHRPTPVDIYRQNRVTGSFVLIDRESNLTVGAGMVVRVLRRVGGGEMPDTQAGASTVSPAERARLLGHGAGVVWISGEPYTGKSSLAVACERALVERGINAAVLDSSAVRRHLSTDLGFSRADRREQVRRLGELASVLADAGSVVLVATNSPFAEDRAAVRDRIGADRFREVHCTSAAPAPHPDAVHEPGPDAMATVRPIDDLAAARDQVLAGIIDLVRLDARG